MSEPLKFGVIGCGHMGATADEKAAQWIVGPYWTPLSHAGAIAATEGTELAAVCDLQEAAAQSAMKKHGAKTCYTDYREMLRNEKLDAVAIATRTAERKEVINACLDHGVPGLFCEKPLCLTLEDADELTARLKETKTHFVYGTRRRFMPVYRRVKEEIRQGRIGTIQSIVVRFGHSALLWTHPHSVDTASFFADDSKPEFVKADLVLDASAVSEKEVDADPLVRSAYIRFSNGIGAHLVDSGTFDVEIFGSEGMATVFSDGAAVEWRTRLGGPGSKIDPGYFFERERVENKDTISGTVESIRTLMDALHGKNPFFCDPQLAAQTHEILFGMVYSHLAEGRRIFWPLERRGLKITGRIGNLYP